MNIWGHKKEAKKHKQLQLYWEKRATRKGNSYKDTRIAESRVKLHEKATVWHLAQVRRLKEERK